MESINSAINSNSIYNYMLNAMLSTYRVGCFFSWSTQHIYHLVTDHWCHSAEWRWGICAHSETFNMHLVYGPFYMHRIPYIYIGSVLWWLHTISDNDIVILIWPQCMLFHSLRSNKNHDKNTLAPRLNRSPKSYNVNGDVACYRIQ